MLDLGFFHQAAGLHSFTPHAQVRVLAVASHDDGGAALDTLWQICAQLQRLGYPVVVLDGSAAESAESPGLAHLLQQAHFGDDAAPLRGGATATSLAVIPSARGLVRLAQGAGSAAAPLARLLPHFRRYGIVVLHAPAATLAPLLTHTATVPLVLMHGGAAGVLASYQSVKLIALHAGLACLVAAVAKGGASAERHKAQAALQTLHDCARRHLGGAVRTTTTVAADHPQDLQRLALQLLENAGTIDDALAALPAGGLATAPAHLVRNH